MTAGTGNPRILLASGSPRRAELLRQIGLSFEVRHPDIDESVRDGESPQAYVARMAREKARTCILPGCVTLAADTAVVLDGHILGKPPDGEAACAMLCALGGRSHRVLTGVAVADAERLACRVVAATVSFRPIGPDEARRYVRSGEGADKAGGYGIQGIGSIFADNIEGSYSAVVGLPLAETERLLTQMGVDTWRCRADG